MKQDKEVQVYFEEKAKAFDDIYDNRGGVITKLANAIFRGGMTQRFNITMKYCGSGKKKVLDIGCGAGRFAIPLAKKGMNVTGLDYSEEMIKMAKDYLKNYEFKINKKLPIKYICCDFLTNFHSKEKFDITIAMGIFDYLKEPLSFLKKMKDVTKGITISSFPKRYTFQMPIRKIWLWTKNCPVYFYTKKSIKKLYRDAGFKSFRIINVAAGYAVLSKN